MFRRIFLSNIDNLFRGKRIALWIFIIVLIIKTAQNLFVIIGGASIISSADGIPLERYSQEAAQTIVYLWTYVGFIRLLILILGFLILFRYRSLIPLMFVFLLLQDISRYIISFYIPITKIGTPPGNTVNLALFVLTIIGMVLSVLPGDNIQSKST